MTRQKLKLTDQECHARLLHLKQLGITIGPAADPSPEPDRLILEQIDHEFARLFELPSGAIAVLVPARMTVLSSGILITDLEMTTAFDDWPLDLTHPEEWHAYKDVIDWSPSLPTKVLNHMLTKGLPLRHCQVEGVIVANGWSVVPPQYHDETLVRAELLLMDERRNEICVEFGVRVDRILMRKYERKLSERRESARLTKRRGLFEREQDDLEQKSALAKKAIEPRGASGDDDAKRHQPN